MSEYVRHTWEDGETITDEKLNNLEEGVEEAHKMVGQIADALDVINGEAV